MGQHGKLASDEEVSAASKEGFRGAVVGACRVGRSLDAKQVNANDHAIVGPLYRPGWRCRVLLLSCLP